MVLVDSGCSSGYHGHLHSCANANRRHQHIPEKSFNAQPVWLLFTLLLCSNEHYDMLDNRWDIRALWKTSLLEKRFSLFLQKSTRADAPLSSPATEIYVAFPVFLSYLLHRHPILIASSSQLYTQLPQRMHLRS